MLYKLCRLAYSNILALCPIKEYRNEANVTGLDLFPFQPAFVPPNCEFQIDNLEEDWTWSGYFDFIHARMLSGCFKNPRYIVSSAYKQLTPGGYFEVTDILYTPKSDDETLISDSLLCNWANHLASTARGIGRPLIRDASDSLALSNELETIFMALFKYGLRWDPEAVIVTCALVRKEFKSPDIHAYFPLITVYGRKPYRPGSVEGEKDDGE
ncbi:hypothetical protein QBC40DRAFT_309858 [Triangularia verruculosa]|uniref:Uncharacterized protein n=1 Tax=Triangularia verruculosa TaxID=2587418 RepID=A0AAN7ARA3_9PEZI|nr:hypothetical protein QBC40DRAFT_309858 [Triangularia verruculosa]